MDSAETSFQSMSPLSVEIPDMDVRDLSDSSGNQLKEEIPALLLQNTTPEKESRKRKESKCLSNSPPLRSNSEETLLDSKDKDIRRCSSDENVLNTAFITAVNKFENLNFRNTSSPHPPEAKRRELESERFRGDSHQSCGQSEDFDQNYYFKENFEQKQNILVKQKSLSEEIHIETDLNHNLDSKENIHQNNENQNNMSLKMGPSSQLNEERNSKPLVEITPSENMNYSDRSLLNWDLKEKIPHLDFKNMYQNSEANEPILSEHRYSWPRSSQESESCGTGDPSDLTNNPSNSVSQFLKKAISYEAPLSPSAYRSYLSNRTIHLDPTIPPTPPVEQMQMFATPIRDAKHLETTNTSIRSITKKIQAFKRKVKHFEHEFEKENGFRPSLEHKMSSPEVRIYINEMNKLKKDLKEFKDDFYMEVTDRHSLIPIETKEFNCNKSLINISETIKEMERNIEEKRKIANRPEILDQMTSDEVVEEKLTLQKSLLRFEALYGRPTTKAERDIVRPLYDR